MHDPTSDRPVLWSPADETIGRYRALLETVDAGLFHLDGDGRFVGLDDALVDLAGRDRDSLVGAEHTALFEDALTDLNDGGADATGSDGAVRTVSTTVLAGSGDRVPVEVRFSHLDEDPASVVGAVRTTGRRNGSDTDGGVDLDGSDSGAAVDFDATTDTGGERDHPLDGTDGTRGLHERGAHERAHGGGIDEVLDRVTDAFYAVDTEWRVTHANTRVEDLTGTPRDELVGENVWDVFTEAVGTEVYELDHHAMETGEPLSYETYFEPWDTWFESNLYPSETGMSIYFRDVTERKEREQRLRRYETIVETVNDGIYVVDEDRRYTMVNEAFAELTGYERADLVGEHVSLVVDEEAIEMAREAEEAMEAAEAVSPTVETEIVTASGDRVPVEAGFALLPGEGREYRVGVTRDLSDRRERERRLRESEERYRALAEHFPNGIVTMFDRDRRYTLAAGRGFDVIDAEPEDLEGRRFDEVWDETSVEALEPVFEAVLDGSARTVELSDAGREWVVHGVPITDGEGTVLAGMTMAQDITERKRAERELQRHRDQLETLVQLLPVGVVVADADGRLVRANDRAREMWGGDVFAAQSVPEYDPSWTTVRWADTGEPVPPEERTLARALRGEEVTDPDEFAFESLDGDRRVVRSYGMPIRDAEGRIARGVVVQIDVTELREYQRRLEASNERLESSKERLEASKERLEASKERLEASNERLEQFAYAASHDLQEPLRMVASYLSLLERRYGDDLDGDAREFLGFAVDGAERMRHMIEALLEYSRVEKRGDPFEAVDLDAVLADVREDYRMRIAETDAEVTADPLPTVEGDPSQLRRVLGNLLDNALEYSGEGTPRVHVSAERRGEECLVAVSDEGVGVDPSHADRIFEVFERLHTHEDHPGTGIGLALCRRIVERHGGDIWVDAERDDGTTFYFTLPICEEDDG